MSGRKVSQAELIRQAREDLEKTCRESRHLADEAARVGRQIDVCAAAVKASWKDATKYVPDAVRDWETANQACHATRTELEDDLRKILQIGRSDDDRLEAARAAAAALRTKAAQTLAMLRQQAENSAAAASRISHAIPAAQDRFAVDWVDQQRALHGLVDEIRRRRRTGELASRDEASSALADEVDRATASREPLPPGRIPELERRLTTLLDECWREEEALQTRLAIGERVTTAMREAGFSGTGVQRAGATIFTGRSGNTSLTAQIDGSGDVHWEALVETDGGKAPACSRELNDVVAAALRHDVALTGFQTIEGPKPLALDLPAARTAEKARRAQQKRKSSQTTVQLAPVKRLTRES